jgi:hypothetical protein
MIEKRDQDNGKLIHDINADLSAIDQALYLIEENKADSALIEKVLKLSQSKMKIVLKNWSLVKKQLSEK